jgi:hypothetical protein
VPGVTKIGGIPRTETNRSPELTWGGMSPTACWPSATARTAVSWEASLNSSRDDVDRLPGAGLGGWGHHLPDCVWALPAR